MTKETYKELYAVLCKIDLLVDKAIKQLEEIEDNS